jgi:hypothetical protein
MGNENIEALIQGGAMGLCVLFLFILWYVLKGLLGVIQADVRHIRRIIDCLPCRTGQQCSEEDNK